jgi:hypothetical protein
VKVGFYFIPEISFSTASFFFDGSYGFLGFFWSFFADFLVNSLASSIPKTS